MSWMIRATTQMPGKCFADGDIHTWDTQLGSSYTTAISNASSSYDSTDLEMRHVQDGHTSIVDIWFQEVDLDGGAIGLSDCITGNGTNRCSIGTSSSTLRAST